MLNADTSVSTTPDGDSIVGRLNRIWNVIYRHSRFYDGGDSHASDGAQAVDGAAGQAGLEAIGGAAGQADDEMDSHLARFNALEEYLEHPAMDIDERIKGVFGV